MLPKRLHFAVRRYSKIRAVLIEQWEIRLFWFCKGSVTMAIGMAGKTKCTKCGSAKNQTKNMRLKKAKNTEGAAGPVGGKFWQVGSF